MKYVSDEQYYEQLKRIEFRNDQILKAQMLKEAKYKPRKHIETSKLIAIYLFALLNIIILYSMIAMWHFSDLSYLGVLITDICAQILTYAIYCLKAYHGKKQEEKMKFLREETVIDEDELEEEMR